jgi:hypothetical protein
VVLLFAVLCLALLASSQQLANITDDTGKPNTTSTTASHATLSAHLQLIRCKQGSCRYGEANSKGSFFKKRKLVLSYVLIPFFNANGRQ